MPLVTVSATRIEGWTRITASIRVTGPVPRWRPGRVAGGDEALGVRDRAFRAARQQVQARASSLVIVVGLFALSNDCDRLERYHLSVSPGAT